MRKRNIPSPGFTIVELLIVIVVIAILAAISLVAYRGIQERARASQVTAALTQAKTKLELYKADAGAYPTTGHLSDAGVSDTEAVSYQYASDGSTFCITGTTGTTSYKITNTTTPEQGGCAGHGQGGVEAITNYATNPHGVSPGSSWSNQTPVVGVTSYVPDGANDGGSTFQVVTTQSGQLRIGIAQSLGSVQASDVIGVSLDVYAAVPINAQVELGTNGSYYPKSPTFSLNAGWQRINTTVSIEDPGPVTVVQLLGSPLNSVGPGQTWKVTRALITKEPHLSGYADGNSPD